MEIDNKLKEPSRPLTGLKRSMFYGASPIIFVLAKKLRNNVTSDEMLLWGRLRDKFPDVKFRRQHPLSIYIADLYCHSKKLIIEIDGSIHDSIEAKRNDTERQKNLEELGLTVLRFLNEEISKDMESILQRVEKYL